MDLLTLHLTILTLTALLILYVDHEGYLYFTGKKQTLSLRFITWTHRLVSVGLLLMIATGILLTMPDYEYRLSQPFFWIKMSFVLVLVMNGLFIGRLSCVASEQPFSELTADKKRILIISGALSTSAWIGAFLIAELFLNA